MTRFKLYFRHLERLWDSFAFENCIHKKISRIYYIWEKFLQITDSSSSVYTKAKAFKALKLSQADFYITKISCLLFSIFEGSTIIETLKMYVRESILSKMEPSDRHKSYSGSRKINDNLTPWSSLSTFVNIE